MIEKKRLVIISLATFFLFSLLIMQYFKIQILEGEKWTKEALSQHEFIVKEPFRRGAFFSNTVLKKGHPEKPQPFVFDVTKFHLFADPLSIPAVFQEELSQLLSETCGIPAEDFVREFEKKSRNRKLALWLSRNTKEKIETWWYPYAKKNKIPRNAIYFTADYQRSYPFGKLLGQVLHTIRDLKEESTQEGLPTGGLEAYFNHYLKGKQGKRKLMRSPLNALETDKVIENPQNGADIYLTVNHCIQAIAEEELEKGVVASGAKGGWAVMMDPQTGEILALAQYPFFDPSNYRDFFNNPEKIEIAKVKALTDAFEIGSIMKPITMAISLKANEQLQNEGRSVVFDPKAAVDTTRSFFPGRGSKPLKDPSFHKKMNMYMALQKSSNIYLAQIIDRVIHSLGNEWYRKELVSTFGFGEKTGIELPGEATGLVPTPGKMHPNGTLEWSLPTPYSLAMGHNIMATSIQMLRAYAVFANGGFLVKPTLIRKIVKKFSDGTEEIIWNQNNPDSFPRVLSPDLAKEIVAAMKYSTKIGGTGRHAEIYGYTEAGKTGTAEKIIDGSYSKKRNVSSFIGFAPANLDPLIPARLLLIVSMDEPEAKILEDGTKNQSGGRCSGPVFREIARRTLEYLGVTPDDPYGYAPSDPRYDADKADWIKEVKELKSLYDEWNK
jgi:cell division protein FtsI (penicillin-binding protein 3)